MGGTTAELTAFRAECRNELGFDLRTKVNIEFCRDAQDGVFKVLE